MVDGGKSPFESFKDLDSLEITESNKTLAEVNILKAEVVVQRKELKDNIEESSKLKLKLDQTIKEVEILRSQIFAVVGFLLVIFTFVSSATSFYSPLLALAKEYLIRLYIDNGLFVTMDLLVALVCFAFPIGLIYLTFRWAGKFFNFSNNKK